MSGQAAEGMRLISVKCPEDKALSALSCCQMIPDEWLE